MAIVASHHFPGINGSESCSHDGLSECQSRHKLLTRNVRHSSATVKWAGGGKTKILGIFLAAGVASSEIAGNSGETLDGSSGWVVFTNCIRGVILYKGLAVLQPPEMVHPRIGSTNQHRKMVFTKGALLVIAYCVWANKRRKLALTPVYNTYSRPPRTITSGGPQRV